MKNQIIKGAFILSAAGIATRILGFYYRIFLSRTIGASGMGLFQMIFPVFGLCHSVSIAGVQLTISRFTALKSGENDQGGMYRVLRSGAVISFSLSLLCAAFIYFFSDPIAENLLQEPRCGALLKYISLSTPMCSVHGCICGYYLGRKQAMLPALAQLSEPIARITVIYMICEGYLGSGVSSSSPAIACIGMLVGETASTILCLCFFLWEKRKNHGRTGEKQGALYGAMIKMAYPLTLTRIASSLFAAFEAIMIPITLKKSGLTPDGALSAYGVLTGMAMPFILFPSTITNSLSSMLLPSIAEKQAEKKYGSIAKTSSVIIKYCIAIGVLCTGYFYVYGPRLGVIFFQNREAGIYISLLAWLCPFMYISATIGSVLNGMGETKITFINNLTATCVRLLFIIFVVPKIGIKGCLFGILAGQITCTALHLCAAYKRIHFKYDAKSQLVKPVLMTGISLGFSLFFLEFSERFDISSAISTVLSMGAGVIIFAVYLLKSAKNEI